ncbi:MAG: helix-turn-helix transcriptional regulator [Oscillospiraceae bacterium]|nr:helix-turn-helix transcriptional regulator [Oscillospiraceae bacterium]
MKDKKPINVEVGQRIKQNREAAGLTQEAFAEMVGLGVKHISAIERGVVGVSLNTVRTICRVLSISSDSLLLDEVNKNDISTLSARLERLSPRQYKIAEDVLNKLIEAFALQSK